MVFKEEIIEDVTVTKEEIESEHTLDSIEYQTKPKKEPEPEPEPEPKFEYKLADCHVRKHDEASFDIKLPNSKLKVLWLKDGKPISPNDPKYKIESGRYSRLVINDCMPQEDEVKYTAVIGDQEISAYLTVEDFVEILSPLKDQALFEKEELKLSVTISDKNAPGKWFKDGKPLDQSDVIIIESFNGKHELTIKNCKPSDGGVYTFVAGDAKSECNVNVKEEPIKIVKKLEDIDGLENSPVVFECKLNKPNVEVDWLFNDLPISAVLQPDTYVISNQDDTYTLTLPKCHLKNQGIFTMQVAANPSVKTKAILSIEEAQAEFTTNLEDKTVKEEEMVEFSIEVSKFNAKVKWSLNGERLSNDDNVKITANDAKHTLKIRKCQLSDNGPIECSLPGNKKSTAKLTVEEIPVDIKIESVEVFEKEDAKLEAVLSRDLGKRDVTWVFGKDNKKIGTDSLKFNHDYQKDLQKHILTVRDCTLADSAEFTLCARSSKATATLLVKGIFLNLVIIQ